MANIPVSPIVAPADGGDSSNPQLQSGMSAASCQPYIGASTGTGAFDPHLADPAEDNTINPVDSGPIGHGLDLNPIYPSGSQLDPTSLLGVEYASPDFNDTLILAQADTALTSGGTAIPGAVYDTVTGATLAADYNSPGLGPDINVGDWVWGLVPVA